MGKAGEMKNRIALALLLAGLASEASAQTLANKKTLTIDGALKAIGAAAEAAKKAQTTGVFAVVDDGGNLMALERLDGTFAAGANISIGKARTAALFKKPTRVFEELINKSRTAMTALNDFPPLQGGVPISDNGRTVRGAGP